MKKNMENFSFDEFDEIVGETIHNLCECADKHKIDRNSIVRYFADMFLLMADMCTFDYYGKGDAKKDDV